MKTSYFEVYIFQEHLFIFIPARLIVITTSTVVSIDSSIVVQRALE